MNSYDLIFYLVNRLLEINEENRKESNDEN